MIDKMAKGLQEIGAMIKREGGKMMEQKTLMPQERKRKYYSETGYNP